MVDGGDQGEGGDRDVGEYELADDEEELEEEIQVRQGFTSQLSLFAKQCTRLQTGTAFFNSF